MNTGKTILEDTIKRLRNEHSDIEIQYKQLDDCFYYLKISFDTHDGGRKNYMFSHEPYSELDNWQVTNLVTRILNWIGRNQI